MYVKRWKGCKMSCDVGEVMEMLENEHTHSTTLPSLYLCHNSFSNPSVPSPTSQLILQPLFHFSYITGSSLTSPGELPMHLRVIEISGSLIWSKTLMELIFNLCGEFL